MTFPIHEPLESLTWLYAIMVFAIVAMCWGYYDLARRGRKDPTYWKAKIRFVLLPGILLMGFACYWIYADSHATVEVTEGGGVAIHAGLPGAPELSPDDFDAAKIEILSLREKDEYRPTVRLFGTGAPGFMAGWFRLQNGEKAYLLVTTDRVVSLPAAEYRLLLSLEDPEGFVKALKE